MKYFFAPKRGRASYFYLRKVPDHLQRYDVNPDKGGKSHRKRIEISLGTDEEAARSKWEIVHARYENLFQRWEQHYDKYEGSTDFDVAGAALEVARQHQLDHPESDLGQFVQDHFGSRFDTERYLHPTEEDKFAEAVGQPNRYPEIRDITDKEADFVDLVRAAAGDDSYLTLSTALVAFLKANQKLTPELKKRYDKPYKLAYEYARTALGVDPKLAELNHRDALEIVEFLDKRKPKLKQQTIKKQLGCLHAVYEHAATVYGFRDRRNPFANLKIGRGHLANRIDGKQPLPLSMQEACIEQLLERRNPQDDSLNTFILLQVTGCRISEIALLLKDEVHLDAEIPYVQIKYRANGTAADRRLKNQTSIRDLPLTPLAVKAVTNQLKKSDTQHGGLFRWLGLDLSNASNQINQHVIARHRNGDKRFSAHGLRHYMTNQLREVEPRFDIRNAILGRPIGVGLDAQYGSVTLGQKYEALLKANEPVEEMFERVWSEVNGAPS